MNILIFTYHQFGSLIDSLKYCQYAGRNFNITYLGWDYGHPKVSLENIEVKYVSRHGHLISRNIRLLRNLYLELKTNKYDVAFIHYTRGISLIRMLLPRIKMIFDVRTLSVDRNPFKRASYNFGLKLESIVFNNHTVISDGVAQRLKLKNYKLLPLGADINPSKPKPIINSFHLLYVGTLEGREILTCVKGFEKYVNTTGDENISFTIIGAGQELDEILKYVGGSAALKNKVVCTGKVPHHQLAPYFHSANVGISYIPIKTWYDHQPPTKTFEYLLADLPVIATRTFENQRILKDEIMSELISDNMEDFSKAILSIKKKLLVNSNTSYLSEKYSRHIWENVVRDYFLPIIQNAK